MGLMSTLFPARDTEVYFCDYTSGDLKCEVAADGFVMANGIAQNGDGTLILVADSMGKEVRVFERNKETNELRVKQKVPVAHLIDNVKYDEVSGNYYIGAVTNLGVHASTSVKVMAERT